MVGIVISAGLGVRTSGENLAPEAARIGRALKLETEIGHCWSEVFGVSLQYRVFGLCIRHS